MAELRLYIRQYQNIGKILFPGLPIYYAGVNPTALNTVQGIIPINRQWPQFADYIDVTDNVSDLNKLKLTWTTNRTADGGISPAGNFELQRSASGQLSFINTAYDLLREWLLDDVSAALNTVEVKIVDPSCGQYLMYEIKSQDLVWCEDGLCQFDVTLKQQDPNVNCIMRTVISDNWQGWFQKVPSNGKKHPRFSYCNEVRPNGSLVGQWYLITSLVGVFGLLFLAIVPIINGIILAIIIIASIINFLGGNVPVPSFISLSDFFDGVSTIYIESSGCGREHPAPLIRDYILNVCERCGVAVGQTSAPVFFNSTENIETSTGIEQGVNPFYNACYLSAASQRGIRRFRRASILAGFQDPNNEYYIPENAPLLSLDMFLDQICPAFNHDWRIQNNTLYIQRKDWFLQNEYIYDFTIGSADRQKILQGICYEPNAGKFPSRTIGIYTPDGSDTCGNEAGNANGSGQMNGALSFGDVDDNPNFEGLLDKTTQLGATKFRLDGASTDYIYDAFQVIMNGGAFSFTQIPGITFTVLQQVSERLAVYGDYALLLSNETAIQPKILIWDGESYENAKAVRPKAAWPAVAPQPIPDVNPLYNGAAWNIRHPPHTDVIGRNLTLAPSPDGIYRVTDVFGIILTERPALLVNYPMYFEPFYKGTLWDRFHWIDDPHLNPKLNMNFTVKIKLCCEDLIKLGVLDGATDIVIGKRIKMPFQFYKNGVIKEITVSYGTEETYGQYIEIKGEM